MENKKKNPQKTSSRLNLQEDNFRNLFHSIRDSILVTDTQRKITQFNLAFTDLFGYAAGEIEGRETAILYDDPEEFRKMGAMIRENIGKPGFLYTISYKKKNGDVFPGETSVFYLKDKQEEITGFIGMIRDVTARELSEEKLQHSRNLMQYVIEHTKSAIAVHDLDLRYIYVSQRYLDDYKIRDKDIIGKHHYDVFPDLPLKWREVHKKALKGEISYADRDPYERADGTVDWTRWECRPWYENDGNIGGIIVYTEVITDRIEAENAIIESERRMATLISNLTGMVYRCKNDQSYTMEFLSAGCLRITGYSAEELINNQQVRYVDLIHPDDQKMVRETIDESIQKNEPFILEYRIINKKNNLRWVWEQGRSVTDPDNTPHLEGYINDITDKKLLELELISLKEKLEKQVDEKTRELQEKIASLERFHEATVEREFRIKELKNDITRLRKKLED